MTTKTLSYYVDDEKIVQKGSYNISDSSCVEKLSEQETYKWVLSLKATTSSGNKESILTMSAKSEAVRDHWFDVITEVICGVKINLPDISPTPFFNTLPLNILYPGLSGTVKADNGIALSPEQANHRPAVTFNGKLVSFYTLTMVDLDQPSRYIFTTFNIITSSFLFPTLRVPYLLFHLILSPFSPPIHGH